MQSTILAAASIALVAAQYNPAPPPPAVVETTVGDVQYYYADYDNIVVTTPNSLWYSSSLSADAVKRETGQAVAGSWSQPVNLNIDANTHYNLKGATFCGQKDQWGKYTQVFVAEAGDEQFPSAVYGWKVQENAQDPAGVQLVANSKWTVYNQDSANVTDVECGPNNGLFIADKGNNAIYWVTGAALNNTAVTPQYAEVVPEDCGGSVAEVRSLSWNQQSGQLVWTNNAAAAADAAAADASVADPNAGVFQYGAAAGASPNTASCKAQNCDAWSSSCSSQIKQVQASTGNDTAQYWAVSQAWGDVQVSEGGQQVYSTKTDKAVANVASEATYAQATDAQRNSLLVADQQAGAVYAVQQGNAKATQIASVDGAYGVAYNQHGQWVDDGSSASTLALSFGAVLAVAALFF